MKSFNGLYDKMIKLEEIKLSIKSASENKRKRADVRRALANLDKAAKDKKALVESGNWRPPRHEKARLCEGSHKKTRMIEKPRWKDEQIIHHMLMRQFRKIVLPRTYRYSCGSVPGRGPHFAVRTMKRWRDGYNGKKFYVAELDIKGFYDNVDVELLKTMLQKVIRDKRYLDLLFRVIDGGAPGLPKGFYTSPWLANFMLTPLDNYITQVLRPDHYLRFMDNMFLFSRNKKQLHKMVTAIEEYLGEKLHLRLKEDWQVFRFEYEPTPIQRARAEKRQKRRPPRRTRRKKRERKEWGRAINCLGFVIHHNRVTIRKSILKRTRAKANRIKRKGKLPVRDAASMVSRMGWFKFTDTYNYYLKWIKPKISIQYCKRRISAKAKKKGVNKK